MKPPTTLYYSGSTELGISEWEQVVSNLITYGDVVWLRSRWEFSPSIPEEQRFVLKHVARELIEARKIASWELEDTFGDPTRPISRMITIEEQKALYERVNYAMTEGGARQLREDTSGNVERTSRFIQYRQEVWNLGLASLCDCSGIVFRHDFSGATPFADPYKYDSINKNYVCPLFETFQIGGLSSLSAKDIVELQNSAGHLRSRLDKLMGDNVYGLPADEDTVNRNLESLYAEYHENIGELIYAKSKRQLAKGVVKESVLAVAGLYLQVLGLVPIAEKLVEWLRGENRYGFVLYMHHLKQKTSRRG